MTFSITFSDGSKLEGLKLNGNNFVSDTEVTDATFAGKLRHVVIDGDIEADDAGLISEHEHMELIPNCSLHTKSSRLPRRLVFRTKGYSGNRT